MKILKTILICLIIFTINPSIAQINISVTDQKTMGGGDFDIGVQIKKYDNGYIVLSASQSQANNNYDRTAPLNGGMDYWIIGFDNNLWPKWQYAFGGNQTEYAEDFIITESGNIIIIGISGSPISNSKTVANFGQQDLWAICIDTSGNINWQNVYGGVGNEYSYSHIIKLNNGNYLIGTTSNSDISGTKTEDSKGEYDYWIFEIDSLGNKIWDKTIGGSLYERLTDINQTTDSTILLSGNSNSPISGDKTEDTIAYNYGIPFEMRDLWIVNYDFKNDNILWDRTLGGRGEEWFNIFSEKIGNSTYIVSSSTSDSSGTKTTVNMGAMDVWLNKLDENGNIIWDKSYGGEFFDSPAFIKKINNTLLIGATSSSSISATKSEDPISTGYSDYWLFQIDTNGIILWDKVIGGDYSDEISSIIIEDDNNFVVLGSSLSGISGHKNEPIRGSFPNAWDREPDNWIVELNTTLSVNKQQLKDSEIVMYPIPASSELNYSTSDNLKIDNIIIYDITGKEVNNFSYDKEQGVINISLMNSGIYIVLFKNTDGEQFAKKLIVD